ncbi:hypothetical protein [Streptomyces sp. NPDC020996]
MRQIAVRMQRRLQTHLTADVSLEPDGGPQMVRSRKQCNTEPSRHG